MLLFIKVIVDISSKFFMMIMNDDYKFYVNVSELR